jgi:predicted metalloprotease with PDZ domain
MPEAVTYTLRFPRPEWHGIEVEASFPTGGSPAIDLMMAIWTPGSYLVREYARHVEEISAHAEDGSATPLPLDKVAKNRWRVQGGGRPRVTLRYRLYARELSVRTNFVESGFALVNGAATFITLAGDHARPHEVRVVLPDRWQAAVSALPLASGAPELPGAHAGGTVVFRAADFDQLVDSPIYAGNAPIHQFEAGERSHLLVNEGEDGALWDGARSACDAARVARQLIAFWGFAPYERYVFLNLIVEGTGGLEHADSSVLMTSRWRARSREGWLDWLGLVSHELFHAWNGKRLHPAELAGFDYEREIYSRGLWEVEGVTSYYDDLLVHRAGLSSRGEYLRLLGKQIETLETTPGRHVQSLAEASFDTWIKYYRRDENFPNSGISYYTKGAVVSFLLDARIRRSTGGAHSLDDALRLAYRRFSGGRGFQAEELAGTASEIAGADLAPWLATMLDSTGELEYREALDWYGLRFCESENGARKSEESPAWLGLEVESQSGRHLVSQVRRGTPAHDAGVNVGDELLAVGEFRVPPDGLRERLKHYRAGDRETLLVARRERLTRLPVVFGAAPGARFRLDVDPASTAAQRRNLDALLAPTAPPAA